MKYFNKISKTEAIKNIHFKLFHGAPDDANVVELAEDNAFFQPLPKGHRLTFDADGLPTGTEAIVIDPAELEASKVDALYRAAMHYQNSKIDLNLSNEMQKSESIVEAGVLLEVDLPKAKACGDWLTALWADYYTRKAAIQSGDEYTRDFSNNGDCPHSFAEVRDERKAALIA